MVDILVGGVVDELVVEGLSVVVLEIIDVGIHQVGMGKINRFWDLIFNNYKIGSLVIKILF